MKYFKLSFILLGLCIFGCAENYNLMEFKREPSFFEVYKNPHAELNQAAEKIESIKLLQTSDQYPIRLAIYDDGQFYYQVDQLGNGTGTWKYEDGGLKLTTRRKIFDMNFYVTAVSAEGDKLVVKFFDRHGYNEYPLEFRDPTATDSSGQKPGKLREFKSSIKDI